MDFGHRFVNFGPDGSSKIRTVQHCLKCGGEWFSSLGHYHDAYGADPVECTGDTEQCHGEGDLFVTRDPNCNCNHCQV